MRSQPHLCKHRGIGDRVRGKGAEPTGARHFTLMISKHLYGFTALLSLLSFRVGGTSREKEQI